MVRLGFAVVSNKALGWESFVFWLRLRCAVIVISTVELEKHFGRKYQGCWGAVFLSKPIAKQVAQGKA